jgi:hypothetical protein
MPAAQIAAEAPITALDNLVVSLICGVLLLRIAHLIGSANSQF